MNLTGIVEVLTATQILGQSAFIWLCFMFIILLLLVIDLGLLNRRDEIISPRKSLVFSGFYVVLSIIFGLWLWSNMGANHGVDYFTAYLIEMSLSLDNLFVMSVILSYFAVPRHYQHRVLFWGIIGVLVMRGLMIGFGVALINAFSWVLFIFAGFLVLTGIKMLLMKEDEAGLEDSVLIRFFQKHMRFTKEISGHSFLVRRQHPVTNKFVTYATPLFMALLCIEFLDVLFALDSVPAVFAITREPFVVYTSNIFAILGLRSMYFAMAAVLERFKYMKYALSVILIFIGLKVFYGHLHPDLQIFGKIEPFYSLAITIILLLGGVVFSLIKTRSDQLREEES
jgi:tellurite resistance protein TerC